MECGAARRRIIVIGAGQLGTLFAVFLDRWQRVHPSLSPVEVTLVERASGALEGATRASWIDHATGFEYFKRGEVETARACIEGSVTKRLLLPKGLLDMPVRIRNRFFVSAESHRRRSVAFDDFYREAERGEYLYRTIYQDAVRRLPEAKDLLSPPDDFMRPVAREEYHGVSGEVVAGGLESAGGMSNTAMDHAFKRAALDRAVAGGRVSIRCESSVTALEEDESGVTVTISSGRGTEEMKADYVILTAAHGISDLAAKVPGQDLPGAYHLNFMLHVKLPRTADAVLQKYLASVNFVLQGADGGMYACVVPPTADDDGLAAMFAPGYDASYIDEYQTNASHVPPLEWNRIISTSRFPGSSAKVKAVVERISTLNPFLKDYLPDSAAIEARPVVGSVFNPHGDVRSIRRLVSPALVRPARRVLAMTSPKWTTAELAALTLLQLVLECYGSPENLRSTSGGFGPSGIDVVAFARDLRLTDVKIDRSVAERYLDSLQLPSRLLPPDDELFAGYGDR
jgi:hypothetical protein